MSTALHFIDEKTEGSRGSFSQSHTTSKWQSSALDLYDAESHAYNYYSGEKRTQQGPVSLDFSICR